VNQPESRARHPPRRAWAGWPIADADRLPGPALCRILDEIGAIVWEGDPQTYAFTYVSSAAERLLGYPASRWIDEPTFWLEHIHPDDREWVVDHCREHTARLEEHELDYRMIAASGQVVWLRDVVRVEGEGGRPVRSVGVMVDVTSLKHAEERAEQAAAQLALGEAQWRSLVNGVPDRIALLDEHGRVEFFNRAPDYGGSVDELTADAFMDPNSAAAWHAAFEHVVATGEMRELEVCVAPPGAPPQWFMTRIVPVQIAGRCPSKGEHYLSISTDITERKRLEAQLRQQQRLESVGTLASGVAHEINNPVQGILNYAELLDECAAQPETVREFAAEITRESNRVAAIVRKLLAFSRQELEQPFEHCTVRSLLDDTLSLVHAVLRKDQITIELDMPDGLPQIHCRMQQIQQIIMNLVTNARDALNERYERFDAAKRIAIRVRAPTRDGRSWVRISVTDRAGGIPADVRPRIFDPFFTTKGRDHGTGLGLAVSHGIAADHGGELSVESELGIGSTFHLDLPADPTAPR
jgi:PAS domain S-box-containing protein